MSTTSGGEALEKEEYQTKYEPIYKLKIDSLKPDLIATRGHATLILDDQVVSDQSHLDTADESKTKKYSDRSDLLEVIRQDTGADIVLTMGITLNWRDCWSKRSANTLLDGGIIRRKDLKVISLRAIIGGLAI